jgi:hypothetical protein
MPKELAPRAGQAPVPVELIERRIYLIRGRKVMLDADLAEIYQVLTKNLNLAVRRNADRFPPDFMFQLTEEEVEALRLQIATSKIGHGGRRYLPYAFTEHGVAMLSSVLSSKRAVQMNIVIIRAFIKLREIVVANRDLARRLDQAEVRLRQHGSAIGVVVEEIKKLRQPSTTPKRRMGF